MPNVQAIVSRLDKVLNKFTLTDKQVFKRVITRTGGDPLTGRGVSVGTTDTLLSPQPAISPIPKGGMEMALNGSKMTVVGEYTCLVSVSALSLTDIENPDLTLVFKLTGLDDEELYIDNYIPSVLNGQDVCFTLILCSKKR